ncbi:MarR family transcriptional regulator [Nocardia otitidiscaviarum]|uniref:helix-turn-helix domain-containing protein n=1 Tax=Nocardia otitidiscaviarum TaxID=1823 RepID=UPI0018938F9F|nr:MarR family transcriptional regulator [Nocardia otitidiscaviarum]MBF6239189.1 MarR family transcriptional regulator [Nocardia otitidiscaviarum]
MSTTAPATLTPSIVGQTEKHHTAVLTRSLDGTTLDEKQWITLNQAVAAGQPVERAGHAARVASMTRWDREDVDHAVAALLEAGLLRTATDGRLQVTDSGTALTAEVRATSSAIVQAAYGAVTPDDLATAARVLATITTRMAEELARV